MKTQRINLANIPVYEITAGHRSLSGAISCVTDRIRFLPITMTGRFSNFNSISYTEDRHESRATGTKCRLPDTMSGTGKIFISGAGYDKIILTQISLSIDSTQLKISCDLVVRC